MGTPTGHTWPLTGRPGRGASNGWMGIGRRRDKSGLFAPEIDNHKTGDRSVSDLRNFNTVCIKAEPTQNVAADLLELHKQA